MNAYLFDVDGVLTNPQRSEEINPEMIPLLVTFLQKGSPLGFITGRAMIWLRAKLVKAFEKYVEKHPTLDKNILDLLFVSGEFGVVRAIHKNGDRQEFIEKEFILPSAVKNSVMLLADEFSDQIIVETEKQTIFSCRYITNDEKGFAEIKDQIISRFQELLKDHPELEVQSDRISINIRYKKANKSYATDNFLAWLKEKGLNPDTFYVFGDSRTDLEMGEELYRQQLPFEFIYVGEQTDLANMTPPFPVQFTKGHCDVGTIEYLNGQE